MPPSAAQCCTLLYCALCIRVQLQRPGRFSVSVILKVMVWRVMAGPAGLGLAFHLWWVWKGSAGGKPKTFLTCQTTKCPKDLCATLATPATAQRPTELSSHGGHKAVHQVLLGGGAGAGAGDCAIKAQEAEPTQGTLGTRVLLHNSASPGLGGWVGG